MDKFGSVANHLAMYACLLPPDRFQNKRNLPGQLLTQFGGGTILANSGNNYSFVFFFIHCTRASTQNGRQAGSHAGRHVGRQARTHTYTHAT